MKITDVIRRLVATTVAGDVYPRRDDPSVETTDGRTYALRVLRAYFEELTFWRSGGVGKPPVSFTLKPQAVGSGDVKPRVFIEEAGTQEDLVLPCCVISAPTPGDHVVCALQPYVMDDTRDVYGRGTVLQNLGTDYRETLQLELLAGERAERRALIRGLRRALQPHEDRASLRLRMTGYYDRVASFTLLNSQIVETEVSLGRRKAVLSVELRFTEVELVNAVTFRPQIDTQVTT